MELTIKVNIARQGKLPGTKGWVLAMLEQPDTELLISTTANGQRPGAWLVVGGKKQMLAVVDAYNIGASGIDRWPFNDLDGLPDSFFGTAMTDAGHEAVVELAKIAREKLQEVLDADDQ